MARSEQIRTFLLIGLAFVFFLLTIWLGINWMTGQETYRSEFLMVLVGFGLCASVLWIRFAQRLGELQTSRLVAALRRGLNEAGFVEGQSVVIDYRYADGQYDCLSVKSGQREQP